MSISKNEINDIHEKLKYLKKRLDAAEKTNRTFFDNVQKNFDEIYSFLESKSSVPEKIDERLNEIEDLILNMQIENTEIKEIIRSKLLKLPYKYKLYWFF